MGVDALIGLISAIVGGVAFRLMTTRPRRRPASAGPAGRNLHRLRLPILVGSGAAAAIVFASAIGSGPTDGGQPDPGSALLLTARTIGLELKPANIVVLVDESGSISPQDMLREREAATLIANAELSPKSVVSVVGFASSAVGSPAVEMVCPPTILAGAAEREDLARCIGALHKRSRTEGDETDHVAALRQALSVLRSADGVKLVFLLTDGKLDVSDSPEWGDTAQNRNAAARAALIQTLAEAKDHGVQIWPIGFGQVDGPALNELAGGGYQQTCGPTSAPPSPTFVATSADIAAALLRAFASARCADVGAVDSELESGTKQEVRVIIPPGVTNVSIIVDKGGSWVRADFVDPDGRAVPRSGSELSGAYQVSETGESRLVLRISSAAPGTWKVRFTSPAGAPTAKISTTVA